MKYSAVVFTFVAAVAAQSASKLAAAISACARSSFEKAATSVGCGVTDYVSQCGSKKEQLSTVTYEEVIKACRTESEGLFLLIYKCILLTFIQPFLRPPPNNVHEQAINQSPVKNEI